MPKYIICDYGDAGIGKSRTLCAVVGLFEKSTNAVRIGDMELIDDGGSISDNGGHPGSDIYARYEVDGVRVAICTQGDPDSVQAYKLIESAKWGADVIVCAARDDRTGKVVEKETVDNIYESIFIDGKGKKITRTFDDYNKIWFRNFFIDKDKDVDVDVSRVSRNMCNASARSVVELIEHLMDVKIL